MIESRVNAATMILSERDRMPIDPGTARPDLTSPSSAPQKDDRINVLLVDDEPRNLTVLESILEDPGYRLVRAETGDQALLALMASDFAVIVLDIHMPGMSGFELAQLIKNRRKTASIPIIFLTAHYGEDRHVIEGYQSGAVDYLLKPINPAIVRSKVAVFVELYRRTRESVAANAALLAEVAERRRSQEEIRRLNNELEHRVAERTSELQAANSALHQMESELREVDRRKDQFLAMLGHELRNPLGAIRNAVSLLEAISPDQPDVIWCREVIQRQSEHLTRIVADLLDVSRISRGQIQLDKQKLDLTRVAEEAVETCRPMIEARHHEIVTTFPPSPVLVEGDRTRLTQVMANLINNAAKYTEERGRISVTLETDEGASPNAVIRVRDNGLGLESHAIGNLFNLFYQADVNLARSDGGLGVGLAVVRSLVEMHGGTVEAHSSGLGQGSEFVIRLPCVQNSDVAHTTVSPPLMETSVAPLRILVVDDNVDAARSLGMILKLLGHDVLTAHDGRDAVDVALREKPEVLLLDIGLPGLNGYEVCRSLRRDGLASAMIVAITGYGQEADRELAHDAGFDFHLVKPVALDTIQELLARGVARA